MAHKIIIVLLTLVFLGFPKQISAHPGHTHTDNSFVTIVNPLRISEYTKDYLTSFQIQLNQIESRGFPATWPVTYDVLTKKDFVNTLKNLSNNQELAIFLEVTPSFAKAAEVLYNKSDSWHRANSVFTIGYTQDNRKKLIDTVFKRFRQEFGYYPKSVGSWYIDSYSLDYMKQKYGVTTTINMSDQYDLDGYKLWGTPWSVPYYPSKINAAIPGDLEVLTIRWAARDPLNGYRKLEDKEPSLFSLQDYSIIGLPHSYYENLLKTFALQRQFNNYGHATVGLEGDLPFETYTSIFSDQMDILKNLENQRLVQIVNMKDFALRYKEHVSMGIHIIESNDLTGKTNKKAYWIQNSNYRVGIIHNSETKKTQVIDFRVYPKNLEEPFFKSTNKQFNLSINLPFVIDTVIQPNRAWGLDMGDVKNIEKDTLTFAKGSISFTEKEIIFPKKTKFPDFIKTSPYVTISKNKIIANSDSPVNQEGTTIIDFSIEVPFAIKRRLPVFIAEKLPKIHFPIPKFYTISQTEMDALSVLKDLPKGKVLVFDRDCLNCRFHTKYKPASMAGKKSYVKRYSDKEVVKDLIFSTAKTSKDARKVLKKQNIQYVYLSKYEDYIESLPYLPQDLALTKVYENANAEIWKVKNKGL